MDHTNGEHIEIEVTGDERVKMLLPCLLQLNVLTTTHFPRNGSKLSLTVKMHAGDDEKLLRLWDEITDLRMRYLEARQAERVVQLTYLEGSEEVVVL